MKPKLLVKLFFFASLASLFYSCNDDSETPIVYGDAIVRSFTRGNSTVYGICFFAYSYDRMKNVKVYNDKTGTELSLDSTSNRYTFSYLPDTSSYSTQKPSRSNYTFKTVFDDGTEIDASDILDSTVLEPPVINKYQFDSVDIKFSLDWDDVKNVYQYRVLLEDPKNNVIFQSDFLPTSQSSITITSSSGGWLSGKIPQGGEKYKAIVVAYQYETIPSVFDLQSISFTEGNYFQWSIYNE